MYACCSDGMDEENVVRGDKGRRGALTVTTSSYFSRVVDIARTEQWTIFCAFACLLVSSGSHVVLPNYQGQILDRVIQADVEGFTHTIMLFVIFTVAAGIFQALRQCCFMLVARRVGFTLRCRLYRAILRQDIAFFGEMLPTWSSDVCQDWSAWLSHSA